MLLLDPSFFCSCFYFSREQIIVLFYRAFVLVLEKTCKKVGLRFGLCCVKFVILHPFSGSFGGAAVPEAENRSLEDLHTQKESTRDRQSFL